MKPNFLVVGAPKAATTSLCELLRQHPDVFISEPKEPNFFSRDDIFKRGWTWYESLFEGAGKCAAIGEGSTTYSKSAIWPNTVPRIIKYLESPKIIYSVREPFSRVQSGWLQAHQSSNPAALASFNQSIRESPNFLDESLYWKQICAYRQHLTDDQILVLFFEDFVTQPQTVLRRCFEFLGVDPKFQVSNTEKRWKSTENYYADRKVVRLLRQLPGAKMFERLVPNAVVHPLNQLLRIPLSGQAQWDEETRRWFADQIADDLRTFLEFYGKPPDYWDLSGKTVGP
jgi:hypothetical protein